MQVEIASVQLELLNEKAIFWPDKNILMVADLHVGKVTHFRKAGIPVPTKANDKNLEVLVFMLHRTKPARVILLGDLFHSRYNTEWESLRMLIQAFPEISFELVPGNHDVLSQGQYQRANLIVHEDLLEEGPFVLSHHPIDVVPNGMYNLAGHVHPGIQLRGKGKQFITLPCFYFGQHQGILPAFGAFTGLAKMQPRQNDQIFVVVDNSVIKV